MQVYINHVLQGSQNSTNITLYVGDNVTVVILAVGNISVINASDQDEHFICRTHFACNNDTHNNVHNRRLQCSLQSAKLSDDSRTLVVVLDDMEWKRFIITGEYILLLYCMYLCGVVNSVGNLCVCVCVQE